METRSPTASYAVARIGVRSTAELFDDELVVSQHSFLGNHYRAADKLVDLDPTPFEVKARDQWITALIGLVTIVGVAPFTYFAVRLLPVQASTKVSMFLGWLVGGTLVSMFHPFRVHSLGFRLRSGVAAVYLQRVGRNKAQRDSFAENLAGRIRYAGAHERES